MQIQSVGNGKGLNDLYILPETHEEKNRIREYLNTNKIKFIIATSDVEGQAWFGKNFFLLDFGELCKVSIENFMKDKEE